jgi:vitamin B12 transporter
MKLTGWILVLGAQTALAQETISGVARMGSLPARGVNVFLLETLDGALSDSAGRFTFTTAHRGPATLIARREGLAEFRQPLVVGAGDSSITVQLHAARALLPAITAVAGRYTANDERGSTLSAIDVVSTPGTTADVARAIQTLPGVQGVDEGTGLYVRGGNYTETTVLLNDAPLHTAFTYQAPSGTFIGTVDPFLLDGIFFSSGGFGARYGNALSGLVALNTLGVPERSTLNFSAGLAAVSSQAAIGAPHGLGIRLAANEVNTDLLFRVNGATGRYDPAPHGHDRSGSLIWKYRPTGELKFFAIGQATALGAGVDEASWSGTFLLDVNSGMHVVNWRDVFGAFAPSFRVSRTRMNRGEDYGAFLMKTGRTHTSAAGQLDWAPGGALAVRGGVEWEGIRSTLDGSIPDHGYDKAPDARVTVVGSARTGHRIAAFTELDWMPVARTRVITGVRTDHSSLTERTGGRTIDPRVSVAYQIAPLITATAAWGVYHQAPDPLFLDETIGDPSLPSMRATHSILGIQAGETGFMARAEVFAKRYTDLAQSDRDYAIVGDGAGKSRGVDVFFSGTGTPGMRWRISWSAVNSERTDANTGAMAAAPFDVRRTSTSVISQSLGRGWSAALSHRHASGRPFTPVAGATFDAAENVWVPSYGAPMSERMPTFTRVDLGLTNLRRVWDRQAVLFSGVTNLFDRSNVYTYRYNADYSTRIPVRSLFNRSVYVGASLTFD